jgi:ribonucleoside-diphosphate reductase alpha chain
MWYDNEISMGIMQRKYLHPGEKPEDFIPRVVSIFSDFLQDEARNVLENADFLPAGRTLFGAGFKNDRKVSLSNCYILPSPKDNLESIFDTAKMIARISSYGGGCGLAIDNLRPKEAPVNNAAMTSSGAVSFLNVFDVTGSTIGQNGRRAALLVALRCDHPDIEEFLKIKQDGNKLASMNISIKFTDEFMNAVKNNEEFELHFESPETGRISRKINAAQFFKDFCACAWDYAEPGCTYIDRMRNYQLLSGYPEYQIDVTNPCHEFAGNGGNSCNLGSINVYNIIDEKFTPNAHINYDKLRHITHVAINMLDEILDYGYDMQPLDLNKNCIKDWRSIGLGVFGFADALVAMGIKYGSKESRELVSDIMETIMKQSIITSCELAEKKGTFGKYDLEKTLKSPIIQMFPELHDMIRHCGLRNGSLLSVAPTGTISLFAGGFTGGVEPMYKIAYERASHQMEEQGKSFTIYARGVRDLLEYNGCSNITPAEAKKKFPFLIESHEVPYMDRVYFQAAMQDYVDNSISSTVNLPHDATIEDVYNIYMGAWEQGLKGITVFRDGCKRANILGIDSNKKEETRNNNDQPDFDTVDPPSRRLVKVINGATARESTSCVKSMYVTVNKTPEDKVFEIFTNASGGCKANINTISRLCSLALRGGIKVSRVIDELRANQCPACQVLRRQGKDVSLSCANAIADAMEEIIGEQMIEQEAAINKECPDCGKKTLIPEGKCVTCTNCGWSKCG